MSDAASRPSATENQSREEFIGQMRACAEDAAQASVHHAALSQHYLELSQRYADLAERSGSTQLAELQRVVQQLESEIPASTQDSFPIRSSAGQSALNTTETSEDVRQATDGVSEIPSAVQSSDRALGTPTSDPSAVSSRSERRKRVATRSLVERFRAARKIGRRVRVRAKKSDLKPKQRSATEELRKGRSSLVTSVILFCVTCMLMNLVSWQLEPDEPLEPIICAFADEKAVVEEPEPVEVAADEPGEQTQEKVEEVAEEPEVEPEPEPIEEPLPEQSEVEQPEAEMADAVVPELPDSAATPDAAVAEANAAAAVADTRSTAVRKAMLEKYGGSQASESAVQKALEWLVTVQHPQGYWDFVNVGPSGNPGTINNPIGGTAYALLPFLAAGQTHKDGTFQKQVSAGLMYLTRIGVKVPAGYDLRGMINKQSDDKAPNEAYYVHGAATLALCEAYGMTKDRRLKSAAEGAVQFLVNSQDPVGGGWRYNPQEPGSTSVTAIQVMALMAAKKAGLKVPDNVLQGVRHYLDSVQVDQEGRYGYEIGKKRYTGAVTAMALLCRMYLGWGRDDGDLRAGIALLDKAGPYENIYSLYFATQVMKHWGGQEWERWNARLRDDLVAIQQTTGPANGSWKPRTGAIHAKQGGRLLTTVLATLTLEVYYRHQPLLPEQDSVSPTAPPVQ